MKEDVLTALGGTKVKNAVDCISAKGIWVPLAQFFDRDGGGVVW